MNLIEISVLGYLSLADFDEALSTLLEANLAKSFTTLQQEQTTAMNAAAHDIRMDPAEGENHVTWSLSQWANLRISQLLPQQGAQEHGQNEPEEYQQIRNIFPEFYQSFPNQ